MKPIKESISEFRRLLHREIWDVAALEDKTSRGRYFAFLRIFSILWNGLGENKLPSQAAALSYYSLIALGPLVAIGIMASSFIVQDDEGEMASRALEGLLSFIAAPASLDVQPEGSAEVSSENKHINPDLVAFVDQLVGSSRSGTVGVGSALILILIGIQLFTSVESSFNNIWGVRRGRSWVQRTFFYWTLISLGTVLGLASITLLSASAIARAFENIPLGPQLVTFLLWGAPVLSLFLLIMLLAIFYRFIPNTQVQWKGALIGAVGVVICLHLYNQLSFFFIGQIVRMQMLYGSVAIVPVLMVSLFIFWVIILLGGQVTYAVQNVNTLSNQRAWRNVSEQTRETLALAALLIASRRFSECSPAPSGPEMAELIRVPGQILNGCLTQLCEDGFLSPVEAHDEEGISVTRYQPARPLNKMTLGSFKQAFESHGNNEGVSLVRDIDPVLNRYLESLTDAYAQSDTGRDLESILEAYPARK